MRALMAIASAPVLLATLACGPAGDSAAQAQRPEGAEDDAPTIVIVHGAWGGGWAWRTVEGHLRDLGYDVLRPTLTGLGDRVHLARPDVDLDTHALDVVNTLTFEERNDVVLVGHSYGGMVITGVAEAVPERLRTLVYVDAFVPRDGESVRDLMSGLLRAVEGDLVIPTWADPSDPYPRDVPHPLGTMTQPLALDGEPGNGVPAVYIHTREPGAESDSFDDAAARAEDLGWPVRVFEGGHNPQYSAPEAIARLLAEVAAAP
ncbi:MAG TPA: alpha/beta fold hydrolase [Longimicrobiales bacterium]|nr:alpha/beta fold hydrolase [Longimicrobiales bacterium]